MAVEVSFNCELHLPSAISISAKVIRGMGVSATTLDAASCAG